MKETILQVIFCIMTVTLPFLGGYWYFGIWSNAEISLHDYAQLEYRNRGEAAKGKIREFLSDGKITKGEYAEIIETELKSEDDELKRSDPKGRLIQKYKGN